MSEVNTTETGINIAKYIEEKAAGLVAITKPVKSSGNYLFMRTTWTLQPGEAGGPPVPVEGAPHVGNINRQSIADMRAALQAQEDAINATRAQLDAIGTDMDALDAA
jgi:hypothetical protein